MSAPRELDEGSIRDALRGGMAHHDAGRLDEAEAAYREVLRAFPGRPEALALLGDVLHRRGRMEEAIAVLQEASRRSPGVPNFHNKLGLVLAERGRLQEALAAYRAALRLKPDYAEALFNLGNALAAAGEAEPSIAAYRRALAAAPGYAVAHHNLAAALEARGHAAQALAGYRAALQAGERPEFRAGFARCLASLPEAAGADPSLRPWLTRALAQAWVRPADLARAAIALLRADPPIRALIEAGVRAWPGPVDARTLFGAHGLATLGRDRLLASLLENAHACDWSVERFLTLARRALLERALQDPPPDSDADALAFACALARQCFLNDYVYFLDDDEAARARALREGLARALAGAAPVSALRLAVLAAYFPLHGLPAAERLMQRSWTDPVRALLAQQVAEPAEERALRPCIPALTAIADDVSRSVRAQYEESPYPRWVGMPAGEGLPPQAALRRLVPGASFPARGDEAPLAMLVAGCGTGQESVDLARQFPGASILAIDLSLASLAHARRMSRRLDVANVEYAQADIMALGAWDRRFDMISCVGVLHHLADPLAGWRRLLALLRPGGLMQVGLYSESGRRGLAGPRDLIAARGDAPTPDNVRRRRRELLDSGRYPHLAGLRDLYGTNECRDLLFHVQEHRFTLPGLRRMIAALGVEFLGLSVPPSIASAFDARHPNARLDLEAWDAFEQESPDTFAGMYLFWVRKATSA